MAKRRRSSSPFERNVQPIASSPSIEEDRVPSDQVSKKEPESPTLGSEPKPLSTPVESVSPHVEVPLVNGHTAVSTTQQADSTTASPLLRSADGSQSEAPSEVSKQRKPATSSSSNPPRGLDRTIEMLQQSHLWMGGKTLPGLVLDAAAPTVRMTRRMAAAAQSTPEPSTVQPSASSHGSKTLPSVPQESGSSTAHNAETVPQMKPEERAVAATVLTGSAVGVKDEGEQSKPKPAAAVEPPAADQQIELKMGKRKYQYTKLRPVELHVDHPFFERLRFVPLISKKAPVAQEQDVIASSSHCTPRPLSMFANLLLQCAPEEILSRAQAGCPR